MTILKQSLILILALSTIFMASCDKTTTTPCTPPAVTSNIIGTWTTPDGETVEFQSNGTLVDLNDAIIGGSVNNDTFTVKTYTVTTDSLWLQAASATTTNSLAYTFPIVDNQCNEITLNIIGLNYKMTRQ